MADDESNWRKVLVVRILLLIARMFSEQEWKEEIKHLSNHITTH
jgi:hypothetical protein